MLFLVQRPGEDITAEWELFLFILKKKKLLSKISIFSYKKKNEKKKILRPPDWPQFRPLAGQETNFFKGTAGFAVKVEEELVTSNEY